SKGLPLLEAWANGVPAAVPDHGAFPELVTAAGAGVLHRPGDAESLAEALAELLDDPQRAAALGRAGLAYVQTHHDARKMAERTLALYRELVGGVKPAGVAAGTGNRGCRAARVESRETCLPRGPSLRSPPSVVRNGAESQPCRCHAGRPGAIAACRLGVLARRLA
ncbi:MAG TPA: glycosyltransferase, partial [Lacipirellulaceae bacterium]|nr:glycosyltransferase [Lacipirellulaceae bacterium]